LKISLTELLSNYSLVGKIWINSSPLLKSMDCCPHKPIGEVWIYRLLFVCLCVCTVTDFSAEDKASGVKFCTAVHRLPRQEISHFCGLCSPRRHKLDELASARHHLHVVHNDYPLAPEHMVVRRVDVGSACVDIRPSPVRPFISTLSFEPTHL